MRSAGGSTSHPGTICGFNLGLAKPQLLYSQDGNNPGSIRSQVQWAPPPGSQGHPSPATCLSSQESPDLESAHHLTTYPLAALGIIPVPHFSYLDEVIPDLLGLV